MSRWLAFGLLLLMAQAALLVFRQWPAAVPGESATEVTQQLLRSDAIPLQIQVRDENGNQTLLRREGDDWLLPGAEQLPADPVKIQALLDVLRAPRHEWPVASTSAARQRFAVADYLFQRQLTLQLADGSEAVIYLGTSPGFRKVHARREGQQDIYAIAYNAHDVPATDGGWLEPRLLQTRIPLAIAADAYSLSFDGGQWRSGLGLVPDPDELAALLNALQEIQVLGLADQAATAALAHTEAELELTVTSLAGEVTLSLYALADKRYILSSEYPLFFAVSQYDYKRLSDIDLGLISGENLPQGQP